MSSCSLLIWLQNGSGMWSAKPASGDRGLLLLDYSEHIFLDLWYGVRAWQSVWVSFSQPCELLHCVIANGRILGGEGLQRLVEGNGLAFD